MADDSATGAVRASEDARAAKRPAVTGVSHARLEEGAPAPLIRRTIGGRLLYWWSLFVAAMLLLIFAPPVLAVAIALRRNDLVYPWAAWGARTWLRLSGMEVRALKRARLWLSLSERQARPLE